MTPEEQQQIDAENWKRIKDIGKTVQHIRIKPEEPTEKVKTQEIYPWVDKDLPEDRKGIRIYWQGLEWPTKTFPYKDTVEQVDDMKKVIMASIRSYSSLLIHSFPQLLYLNKQKHLEPYIYKHHHIQASYIQYLLP